LLEFPVKSFRGKSLPFNGLLNFSAHFQENFENPVDTKAPAPYTPARRPDGGIGRRASFRCWYSKGCGGSSPLLGTNFIFTTAQAVLKIKKARFAGLFSFLEFGISGKAP
jgi:hypothetical protein